MPKPLDGVLVRDSRGRGEETLPGRQKGRRAGGPCTSDVCPLRPGSFATLSRSKPVPYCPLVLVVTTGVNGLKCSAVILGATVIPFAKDRNKNMMQRKPPSEALREKAVCPVLAKHLRHTPKKGMPRDITWGESEASVPSFDWNKGSASNLLRLKMPSVGVNSTWRACCTAQGTVSDHS